VAHHGAARAALGADVAHAVSVVGVAQEHAASGGTGGAATFVDKVIGWADGVEAGVSHARNVASLQSIQRVVGEVF
jgi:hypothetical protein